MPENRPKIEIGDVYVYQKIALRVPFTFRFPNGETKSEMMNFPVGTEEDEIINQLKSYYQRIVAAFKEGSKEKQKMKLKRLKGKKIDW